MQEVLFEASSYKCISKHFNLIAFYLDTGMLLRVLRAATNNDAETLEVKLSQKKMPMPGGREGETENKPFLAFTGRGSSLSMLQELPISQPFGGDEIDRLVSHHDQR
jgi:HUS1 checkpoint protein